MDYREQPPRPELSGLVKAYWTLEASGAPNSWIEHRAVPDGCVEIIRRLHGRSCWDGEQPELFAAGVADSPATFSISGDASFAAIRLWPWAWSALSAIPLEAMWDRWIPVEEPQLAAFLPDFSAAEETLARHLPPSLGAIGEAVLASASVEEIRRRTGMNPRALQRWFLRHAGMPPSRYLRVLRFQKAFEQVPGEPSLAEHAVAHGFADQAHMAREFKALAGTPAGEARRRATGPFLR
jgi:AraC-like DNA-binding protein